MKTKISEISDFLENIAPLNLQETYDNSGLIVGHKTWEVKSILISLDATEEIIDEAIELGSNLVVSHHPIVFKGLKRFQGNHYVERAIIKAIKNDIAIYSIHTNLDNVLQNGVNQMIASKLSLQHHRILAPKKTEMPEIGSGLIGELPIAINLKELLNLVKTQFNCGCIRYTKDLGIPIQKIAICGGSGSFLIPQAIASGAQVYLTGDLKYHEFFEANDQIILMDIGHFESEQFTSELLYRLLSEKYSNFATRCSKMSTNPVQYF